MADLTQQWFWVVSIMGVWVALCGGLGALGAYQVFYSGELDADEEPVAEPAH
jgi:hypothetical protein